MESRTPQQCERLKEHDTLSALGGLAKCELDSTVARHTELILRKRRPADVSTELLSSSMVPLRDGNSGVNAEPVLRVPRGVPEAQDQPRPRRRDPAAQTRPFEGSPKRAIRKRKQSGAGGNRSRGISLPDVPDDGATYPTERKDESGDVEAGAVSCPDEEPRWIISKAAHRLIHRALLALRSGHYGDAEMMLVELIRDYSG